MNFEVDEHLILRNTKLELPDMEVIYRGQSPNKKPFVYDPKSGGQFEVEEEFLVKINLPKYPKVKVKLVSEDGSIFSIMGRVTKALRSGDASQEDVNKFFDEITSCESYDKAPRVAMKWVNVN